MLGLIALAGCNRAGVDAALGRDCSDGASCYAQANDLVRKIHRAPGAKNDAGDQFSAERAKVAALLQRGCDLGSGASCDVLGSWLEMGGLIPPDLPRAVRLHERGCGLKEFRSCDRLARLYEEGRGVPQDPVLQAKYRKLACDLAEPPMAKEAFCGHESADDALRHDCGDGNSCFRQADILAGSFFDVESGRKKAAPEKAAEWASRAVALFQKSCDLGEGQSCTRLGDDFRLGGLSGIDFPRAARLFKMGCALKEEGSCYQLAGLYRDGTGVPRNRMLQAKYRKLACDFAPRIAKEEFCTDKD